MDLRPGIDALSRSSEVVLESVREICSKLRNPTFPTIPDPYVDESVDDKLVQAGLLARTNLNWSKLSTFNSATKLQDAYVDLAWLNEYFWELAEKLQSGGINGIDSDDMWLKLQHHSKRSTQAYNTSLHTPKVMSVVLRSNEALAAWICYCWAHSEAEIQHPLLKTYGIALNPDNLQHLILDHPRAITAATSVRNFLSARSGRPKNPFAKSADTLAFALAFCKSSPAMCDIHVQEQQKFREMVESRWQTVKKIQQELSRLDAELRVAIQKLQHSDSELNLSKVIDFKMVLVDHSPRPRKEKRYLPVYYEKKARQQACQGEVSRIRALIQAQEQLKPSALLAGLPSCESLSFPWLFFLFMPKEFVFLIKIAQLAQGQLWETIPRAQQRTEDLHAWYQLHRKTNPDAPWRSRDLRLFLGSDSGRPSTATPNVRQFTRDTGVIYPDRFVTIATWLETDPFGRSPAPTELTSRFTEVLPACNKHTIMQASVALSVSNTEENNNIAHREQKPNWLSHEQYLAFSSLREGPFTQFRSLVEAFADNLLPFHNPCVQVLIRQTVFQYGEEDWMFDAKKWHGLEPFATRMKQYEDLLRNSPKDAEQLVVFANTCSFFGQFDQELYKQAYRFSRISRTLGDEVQSEIDGAKEVQAELYEKQARLYERGIRCLSRVPIASADMIVHVLELVTLYRNKCTLSQGCGRMEEASAADHAVLDVIAANIADILYFVTRNNDVLTSCLRLVRDRVPSTVLWSPILYEECETGCFEAICGHQLFSINLLNGIILVDGVPPGFLPHEVVSDPLFTEQFGSINFEMEVLGHGRYQSTRLHEKRYQYEFSFDFKGALHILEVDFAKTGKSKSSTQHPRKLQLLRISEMSIDLPPIFLHECSLWYSWDTDVVVLRGKRFDQRLPSHIMSRDWTVDVRSKFSGDALGQLSLMPSSCYRLLIGPSCLSDTLKVIEEPQFIHVFVNSQMTFAKCILPRYRLGFELGTGASMLKSFEFQGFYIQAPALDDTLLGFEQFLALRNDLGKEKIIVPRGRVEQGGRIQIGKECHLTLSYEVYTVHPRFRNLISTTTFGRLNLAALYASCACLLPDRRHAKPQTRIASELVRQSWTNSPLSVDELRKVREIVSHSQLDATLHILCFWICKSSRTMQFLYEETTQSTEEKPVLLEGLVLAQYRRSHFESRLRPEEELSLFGTRQPVVKHMRPPVMTETTRFVCSSEAKLKDFLSLTRPRKRNFPLSKPNIAGEIVDTMYEDLKSSFLLHVDTGENGLTHHQLDEEYVTALRTTVTLKRIRIEESVLCALREGDLSPRTFASFYSGRRYDAVGMDILGVVANPSSIYQYINCDATAEQVVSDSFDWAMLCVLEDKLSRVLLLSKTGSSKTALARELKCVRQWDPQEHPWWLAYELEQGIQIRPEQYSIVNQLLSERGSVIQLDMGLGKTRVLVPMLILEMVSMKELCRVNVLPTILNEALNFYKNCLSASILRVKLFTLPFDRSIPFDAGKAALLNDQVWLARNHRGCFVTTSQHRNSLLLREHETSCFVDSFHHNVVDIFDESDAILSHDFQLVYAIGSPTSLPAGERRWIAVHCLLINLVRSNDAEIKRYIRSNWVCCENGKLGSFPKLRLLEGFREFQDTMACALSRSLIENPPDELRWMGQVESDDIDNLIKLLSAPSFDNMDSVMKKNKLFQRNRHDILAIRGFLVFGILFHGLQSRYGVQYGLNPALKTRMAVPFSACDTPKYRAQFCHPDIELVFTALTYFHVGLDRDQLLQTLRSLYTRGWEARRIFYASWISKVRPDVPPGEIEGIDSFEKVDLSNKAQFDLIYKHLRTCMEVVSYWTQTFVYPMDTAKFSHRRASNAWNLCDSGGAIGFSGTDDNRLLLPLTIKQVPQEEEELRATNGKRIDLILHRTRPKVELLLGPEKSRMPIWEELLTRCVRLGVQALIDVAGLMAGSTNEEAAVFLSERIRRTFRGVLFFDSSRSRGGEWMVLELEHSRVVLQSASPLVESECFVYFDESRCRGTDMTFASDAVALVTLEPKMTKDKFTQACARLRKLDEGQQLILVGTKEFLAKNTSVTEVLNRIVQHTVKVTQSGLVSFFNRGKDYASFPTPLEDDITLETMYAKNRPEEIDFTYYLERTFQSEELSECMGHLVGYCEEKGHGVFLKTNRLSDECEQEAEEETEVEEQEEVQITLQNPRNQVNWPFEEAFFNPNVLFSNFFVSLHDVIGKGLRQGGARDQISDIKWSEKVYCTNNFWNVLFSPQEDSSLYLRPVKSMLLLKDGRAVLLSTYELNKLLPIWWRIERGHLRTKPKAIIKHLFLSETNEGFGFDNVSIPDDVLVFIKLFRGYVRFSGSQKKILDESFSGLCNSEEVCRRILSMRDRAHHFERSDLESVTFGCT